MHGFGRNFLKDVTFAKLVKMGKPDSFFIPADWLQKIINSEKFAIFLKNNESMFRFIPTKTNNVVQFHMKLTVLEEDFLQKLFHVFEKIHSDHKIQPIYSSGVCFVEEECYYLFLVEYISQDVEKQLKELLSKLQGVEEVLIERYQIN